MKRSFKTVEIEGETYLYPIPVIKEQKYLILCGSPAQAAELMNLIASNSIIHPDDKANNFALIKHHTDGKTAILKLLTN